MRMGISVNAIVSSLLSHIGNLKEKNTGQDQAGPGEVSDRYWFTHKGVNKYRQQWSAARLLLPAMIHRKLSQKLKAHKTVQNQHCSRENILRELLLFLPRYVKEALSFAFFLKLPVPQQDRKVKR